MTPPWPSWPARAIWPHTRRRFGRRARPSKSPNACTAARRSTRKRRPDVGPVAGGCKHSVAGCTGCIRESGHATCHAAEGPASGPSFRRRPESSPSLGRIGRTWTPAFAGVTGECRCDGSVPGGPGCVQPGKAPAATIVPPTDCHSERSEESNGQGRPTAPLDSSRSFGTTRQVRWPGGPGCVQPGKSPPERTPTPPRSSAARRSRTASAPSRP